PAIYLFLGMLIIAIAALASSPRGNELSFLSRYVQEIRAGNGFVFNPGERILLLPYPLLILLYALLRPIGILILASGLTIASWLLLARMGRYGWQIIAISLLVFLIAILILPKMAESIFTHLELVTMGNEAYALWYSLGLLILASSLTRHPILAGITAGLALFCHPFTLASAILAAYATRHEGVRRYLGSVIVVSLVGSVGVVSYFGTGIVFGGNWFDYRGYGSRLYEDDPPIPFFRGNVIAITSLSWFKQPEPSQTIIFLDQPTQSDIRLMIERGDYHSVLLKYAPDTVLFLKDLLPEDPIVDRLWSTEVEIRSERILPIGAFIDQALSADFGPHLKLIGAGVDATSEEAIRVHLDWQIARAAAQPIMIRLRLDDGKEVEDTFEARVFRMDNYSTYHLLSGSRTAKLLHVTVMINDGTVGDHAIPLILN
ncbi:MAG: hypothetical protein U0528_12720, partial [Anaerolineae bacterium]